MATSNKGGSHVTEDLKAWNEGDPSARERVIEAIAEELHRIASQRFLNERAGHTLQPTALVSEAFLALECHQAHFESRAHLLAWIARQMGRILVDHARTRFAQKRGGRQDPVTLVSKLSGERDDPIAPEVLIDLDLALGRLREEEGDVLADMVELRFFGGLEWSEVAQALDISQATIYRRWGFAKTRLRELLLEGSEEDG